MNIFSLPKIGPFCGVQADQAKTFPNGRTFRIVLYGAYQVCQGGFAPEFNGVAVLNEDALDVVCDNLWCIDSGYYGASEHQKEMFDEFTNLEWSDFQRIVNSSKRCRYTI